MLYHVTPKILLPDYKVEARLDKIVFPELGVTLAGDVDVVARKPYPNKQYLVACRKIGNKAVRGLLIDTQNDEQLVVETHWLVDDVPRCHIVYYFLLDEEFEFCTDAMMLWGSTHHAIGDWQDRYPAWSEGFSPAEAQPRMDVSIKQSMYKRGEFWQTTKESEVIFRQEVFYLPTVEPERLSSMLMDGREPKWKDALVLD